MKLYTTRYCIPRSIVSASQSRKKSQDEAQGLVEQLVPTANVLVYLLGPRPADLSAVGRKMERGLLGCLTRS
jgi:hypothetical protein